MCKYEKKSSSFVKKKGKFDFHLTRKKNEETEENLSVRRHYDAVYEFFMLTIMTVESAKNDLKWLHECHENPVEVSNFHNEFHLMKSSSSAHPFCVCSKSLASPHTAPARRPRTLKVTNEIQYRRLYWHYSLAQTTHSREI